MTWDELRLFDPGPGAVSADELRDLSPDRRRTVRRRALLDAGVHPATRLAIAPERGTCGSCVFLVVRGDARRRFFKCGAASLSHSAASDIRKSWPACSAFEADRSM